MKKLFTGLLVLSFVSCGGQTVDIKKEDTANKIKQVNNGDASEQSSGTCTNANINLHSGAGFDFGIVENVNLVQNSYTILGKNNSWVKIKVDANNSTGYAFAEDLCVDKQTEDKFKNATNLPNTGTDPVPSATTTPNINNTIITVKSVMDLAAGFVGFSYWWGGAKFKVGATDKGQCKQINGKNDYNGHTGTYGGDCSGYVAKMWQLPTAMPLEAQSHPYSTDDFYNRPTLWTEVTRKNIKRADALVYRSGSGGHIVIYDAGDDWNQIKTYEAKGCAYGIVHQLRAISTAYKAIRRNGIAD